jgi:Glycosyl transferase family 2
MTVVGGEHDQAVAVLITQVGADASIDVSRELRRGALAGEPEQPGGELDQLGIGGFHPVESATALLVAIPLLNGNVLAMSRPRVALAIPAYNEADGIAGFLSEVDRALAPLCESVTMVVVDDHSTDATRQALAVLRPQLNASLDLIANERNRGHGPSLMTAYRRALDSGSDYVLQVDGDGQFHGSDLRRVLVLLMDDSHAVCGVRRFRQDPWFRMAMTALLRSYPLHEGPEPSGSSRQRIVTRRGVAWPCLGS